MKSLLSILFCAFLIFSVGCKKKSKATENEGATATEVRAKTNSETSAITFDEAENCDEFLDQYEAWMEKYVDLLEKHKDNPIDLVSAPEYAEMSMQAADWASNWSTKLTTSCATDPSYEKRINEIQARMEKKMKEIGLK
ncbi:MAG: DUF6591 domain-containing protein [Aurantibacter sp.]